MHPDSHVPLYTCHLQYPLYTVMVFDDWEQGIPVAFAIQGQSREEDIVVWLMKLRDRCLKAQPSWKPSAVITDNDNAEINAIRYKPHSNLHYVLCIFAFVQPTTHFISCFCVGPKPQEGLA